MTLRGFRGPRYRTIEVHGSLEPRGPGGRRGSGGVSAAVVDTWGMFRELETFRSEDLIGSRVAPAGRVEWACWQAAELAADLNRRNVAALAALDEPGDRA